MTYYLQQNKSREVLSPAILGHTVHGIPVIIFFVTAKAISNR